MSLANALFGASQPPTDMELQKLYHQYALQNNAMTIISNGTGLGQNGYNQSLQSLPVEAPIYNTILWKGVPVPEDWRGAEMQIERSDFRDGPPYRYWTYRISSRHSNDVLVVNVDAVEHSLKDADRVVETLVAALNQRRLG